MSLKQREQIFYKKKKVTWLIKNPNWQEADQLAVYSSVLRLRFLKSDDPRKDFNRLSA